MPDKSKRNKKRELKKKLKERQRKLDIAAGAKKGVKLNKRGRKVEYSAYAPGYTKHFQAGNKIPGVKGTQNRGYAKGIGGSEGGQGGLLVSRKSTKPGKKGGTVLTGGALKNSYGDPVGVGTVGREWKLGKKGKTKVGIHGGATVGYGKSFNKQVAGQKRTGGVWRDDQGNPTRSYSRQYDKGAVGLARKTNVAPVVTGSVSRQLDKKGRFEAKALVNPLYVNAGLTYNFGKGKNKKRKKRR